MTYKSTVLTILTILAVTLGVALLTFNTTESFGQGNVTTLTNQTAGTNATSMSNQTALEGEAAGNISFFRE